MSISTRCPNCDASYNLAEAQRGKKVRCRKCSETFVVGGDKAPAAAKSAKIPRDGLRTSPVPPSRTPPPRPRPSAVRRDRDRELDRDEEEEEADDRFDRRDRGGRREKSGSVLPLILLIGGGVLLLMMIGGGVLLYLGVTNHWFSPESADAQSAAADPGDAPKDVDDAMLWIRTAQTADKQNKAAEWLAQATVIDAKRKDVAATLEKLALNANTHDSAIKALSQWAGPEDVPTLLTAVEIDDGLWLGDKAGGAPASALIRLQADGAAAAFAHRLTSPFSHESAKKLLAELGPKAEKDVLPYMDSPKMEARTDAQDLLRVFGTKPEAMFDQAVADLRNLDSGYRQWACDYISKQPVDVARQAEVAKALIAPLGDSKAETRAAAASALATWATQVDEPALIAELDQDTFGNGDFQSCLDALVRLEDENGAAAIAKQLKNPFRHEKAYNALRAMGKVAEKAVAGYVNDSDPWVSEHANLLIRGYGTSGDVVFDAELADLTGKDGKQRKGACDYFATHPVDPAKQQQVARALEPLLQDQDTFFNNVPDAAAKALGVWGDKDSGPKLIAAMQQPNSRCWQSCVDALVKLKDERAVYPLLALVATKNIFHEDAALRALNDLGPMVVESALDKDLNDPAASVSDKVTICAYLNLTVGTKASIPALTTAQMDPSPLVKNAATGALNAIKKRNP